MRIFFEVTARKPNWFVTQWAATATAGMQSWNFLKRQAQLPSTKVPRPCVARTRPRLATAPAADAPKTPDADKPDGPPTPGPQDENPDGSLKETFINAALDYAFNKAGFPGARQAIDGLLAPSSITSPNPCA